MPWLDWQRVARGRTAQPGLKPAGSLRFKLYDQVIQAAVGGQGVALGRMPLIAEHLRDGRLVAPFPKRYDSARGYYAVVAPHAASAPTCAAFVDWLATKRRARADAALADARTRNERRRAAQDAPSRRQRGGASRMTPSTHAAIAHRGRSRRRRGSRASRSSCPPGARVLDLACGHGRHARFFAARGCARAGRRSRRRRARGARRRRGHRDARARPRGRRVAARRRALRRDRRRQLPASAAVPASARRARRRRRAALRDVRARQRSVRPPVESRFPAGAATSCWQSRAATRSPSSRSSRGSSAAAGRDAVVQRLAAVGPARAWPPVAAAGSRGPTEPRRRQPGRSNAVKSPFSPACLHADRKPRRDRDADAARAARSISPRSRKLIDFHVANGTAGIVIVGTTGESPTVDFDEHCLLIKTAVEHARGRMPVIAGTGANSTTRGDRAHRVSRRRPARDAACRSSRTTTSRRRKACTGISARSPKRSTCR